MISDTSEKTVKMEKNKHIWNVASLCGQFCQYLGCNVNTDFNFEFSTFKTDHDKIHDWYWECVELLNGERGSSSWIFADAMPIVSRAIFEGDARPRFCTPFCFAKQQFSTCSFFSTIPLLIL